MDAVNRVEDSTSGVCDRQDIFPKTTDTRDLLQEYLSTQAQSVPMVSLPTLETEVESTPEPMVTLKDKMNTSQLQCDSHAERNRYSSITPPTDPVATVSHYPSALNPFAPEYTTVSTPKYVYPVHPQLPSKMSAHLSQPLFLTKAAAQAHLTPQAATP